LNKEALQKQLQKQVLEAPYSQMPWDNIEENQIKTVSRTIEGLKQLDFSWMTNLADIYDQRFVTSKIGLYVIFSVRLCVFIQIFELS